MEKAVTLNGTFPVLGPDVIVLKLVAHQLVMHLANTDNKKLHSSHTFF